MDDESREIFFRLIGKNLRAWRKRKGIPQRQAAAATQTSQSVVSRWESGEGMLDVFSAARLAALYGVNLERLLYEPVERNGN